MTRHERIERARRAIEVLGCPHCRQAIAQAQRREKVDEQAYVAERLACSPERAVPYLARAIRGKEGS